MPSAKRARRSARLRKKRRRNAKPWIAPRAKLPGQKKRKWLSPNARRKRKKKRQSSPDCWKSRKRRAMRATPRVRSAANRSCALINDAARQVHRPVFLYKQERVSSHGRTREGTARHRPDGAEENLQISKRRRNLCAPPGQRRAHPLGFTPAGVAAKASGRGQSRLGPRIQCRQVGTKAGSLRQAAPSTIGLSES